jgi:uncharacterized protein (DUF1810 family)
MEKTTTVMAALTKTGPLSANPARLVPVPARIKVALSVQPTAKAFVATLLLAPRQQKCVTAVTTIVMAKPTRV